MVNRYRTKPCEIEAIQFTGTDENKIQLHNFMGFQYYVDENGNVVIPTLEGNMNASVGDYIIKGLRGEFYPCKPDVFEKKYELIK